MKLTPWYPGNIKPVREGVPPRPKPHGRQDHILVLPRADVHLLQQRPLRPRGAPHKRRTKEVRLSTGHGGCFEQCRLLHVCQFIWPCDY